MLASARSHALNSACVSWRAPVGAVHRAFAEPGLLRLRRGQRRTLEIAAQRLHFGKDRRRQIAVGERASFQLAAVKAGALQPQLGQLQPDRRQVNQMRACPSIVCQLHFSSRQLPMMWRSRVDACHRHCVSWQAYQLAS